eukprot:Gb_38496 [translate_table: standard]
MTVLISEDNEAEKNEKNGKGSKDKSKSISEKNKKEDSLTEAPVEIDSRLLSALLTKPCRGMARGVRGLGGDYCGTSMKKGTKYLIQGQLPILVIVASRVCLVSGGLLDSEEWFSHAGRGAGIESGEACCKKENSTYYIGIRTLIYLFTASVASLVANFRILIL